MATGSFRLPSGGSTVTADDWVRPSDWLAMPTIGTQEFIGLLAVTDDESNHIALLCAGNYTVDWGDGVTENVATGVKAQHSYTYSAISSSTLTTRGYKQVLVRVTPQAGQNLTTVNLQQQHSTLAKNHVVSWLDVSVNGSNITTLSLGGASTVRLAMCERVILGNLGAITTFANLFSNFFALQSVSISSSSSVTNFTNMFYFCYSLQTINLFTTSAGTNFSGMFYNCYSLRSLPLINTGLGTNFTQMFFNCYSLITIPLINLASSDNFSQMFNNCYSLITIPLFNTAAARYFSSMFDGCFSLITIPLINTANALDISFMFNNCSSLQSLPLLNTINVTNFSRVFYVCYSLQQLPNLNTVAGTNFANIFAGTANSIAKAAFQGTRYAISYSGMCLSQSAIVDIFNGLGTAVGAQTITVSGNPGYAGLTVGERLIATAKGFIIA